MKNFINLDANDKFQEEINDLLISIENNKENDA